MPIIRLAHDTSQEAICLVFEKVNIGGKKLDAFELVTAMYAADGTDCGGTGSAPWKDGGSRPAWPSMIGSRPASACSPKSQAPTFLQAIALAATRSRSGRQGASGEKEKELPRRRATRRTAGVAAGCLPRSTVTALRPASASREVSSTSRTSIGSSIFPTNTVGRGLAAIFAEIWRKADARRGHGEDRAVVLVRHSWRTVRVQHRESRFAKDIRRIVNGVARRRTRAVDGRLRCLSQRIAC